MAKPFTTMVDLALTDEEKLDSTMPVMPMDRPQYPYGLCISLSERDFAKLGLDPSAAKVGGMCHGHFMARVTSVSENEREGGDKCCRVEMQIENLALESEDAENEEEEAAPAAPKRSLRSMYGSRKER